MKEVGIMIKINNLEQKVIILQAALEIYKNGVVHIDQAIKRIPNPMSINDLNKICTEINRIKETISLIIDTLKSIEGYTDEKHMSQQIKLRKENYNDKDTFKSTK